MNPLRVQGDGDGGVMSGLCQQGIGLETSTALH